MRQADSQGFSLVEIMIAMAIMGIVAVFAARFMKGTQEARVQVNARADAQNKTAALAKLVERDLNFRQSNTSFTLSANGTSLSIIRRQAVDLNNLASSDLTYEVQYISECVSRPSRLGTYQGLRSQLNEARLQNDGRCLKILNCDNSQIPRVRIQIVGTGRIPTYPSLLYPELPLNGTLGDRTLGQALCVTAAPDQLRISVDAIHAFGNQLYKVVSQDKSVSLGTSDYQLLPHEL
jgi:prepilin-type N-terminal cleavage/methylation domain-containing protein